MAICEIDGQCKPNERIINMGGVLSELVGNIGGRLLEGAISSVAEYAAEKVGQVIDDKIEERRYRAMNSRNPCVWFKQNTKILYAITELTEYHILYESVGVTVLDGIKWKIQVTGADYHSDMPNGVLPTHVGYAMIIKRVNQPYTFMNLVELGQGNQQAVYDYKRDVLDARTYLLNGYLSNEYHEGGFRFQGYPGPVQLNDGDSVVLISVGQVKQSRQAQGTLGYIVGTITWQTLQQQVNVNPVLDL